MNRSRTLTFRILSLVGVSFVFLVVCSGLVLYFGLFKAFERVEERLAGENRVRAESFFREQLRGLDVLCFDWAQWDDAYRFVEDVNPEFIHSALPDAAFTDTDTDVCLFVDRSGQVVWRWVAPWGSQVPQEFGAERFDGQFMIRARDGTAVTGIFFSSKGPMFLSIHPIEKSDGSGPVNGMLVMGRYLTPERVAGLAAQLQMEILLHPGGGDGEVERGSPPPGYLSRSFLLVGVPGSSGLTVEVRFPARVTTIGREAFSCTLLVMTVLFLGILSLLGFMIEGTVLVPLKTLGRKVRKIGEHGPEAEDLTPTGPAEFRELARSFNRMLEALRDRDERLAARMEELSQARREAEAANAAKSRFLACMTHDLRTPLNGILGLSRLLVADTELRPAQAAHVRNITASGTILLELIDNILDHSAFEAGTFSLRRVPFNPGTVAGEVLDLIGLLAEQKGLTLVRDVEAGAGAVLGDPGRFRQILFNLLGNALKFTRAGEIGLTLRCREETPDQVVLHLSVFDSGPGIPEKDHLTIFEYFGRAGEGGAVEGTGLGLAITRELTECMGGTIRVENREHGGAEFHVVIPFTGGEMPEEAASESSMDSVAGGDFSLKVLVAEDNTINQILARELFEFFGCTVKVVGDGAEAVACWERDAFDIVFMDWQMPVMDGLAATRRIRSLEAENGRERTPIVGLSANVFVGDREQGIAAGMDQYLGKPFSLPEIGKCLARWGKAD